MVNFILFLLLFPQLMFLMRLTLQWSKLSFHLWCQYLILECQFKRVLLCFQFIQLPANIPWNIGSWWWFKHLDSWNPCRDCGSCFQPKLLRKIRGWAKRYKMEIFFPVPHPQFHIHFFPLILSLMHCLSIN